ncbi:hypothetical protein [Neobacillus muris]|uniref:hypothetical protein n=1 Tax=Neobacillus muris TaxID=2941334 RepID=UPI00203B3B7D|nr:hypothetical protein [Neobacillus muris]
MTSKTDEMIHLTDLSFVQFCQQTYGINRGIYNCIDSWFYSNEIENILDRRSHILLFLEFIKNNQERKHHHPKFGSGGLTIKLQEYFSTSVLSN